mgnify:CR=1 FL=1
MSQINYEVQDNMEKTTEELLNELKKTEDFFEFDMLIGMDDRNIQDLKDRAPSPEAEKKIHRMTDYCSTKLVDYVPDPYYGGAQGFETVLDILEDACEGLLEAIKKNS